MNNFGDRLVDWHFWVNRAMMISFPQEDNLSLNLLFRIIYFCLRAESNFLYLVRDFQFTFEHEVECSVVGK